MILEIALGIVLAVIILAFWDVILSLGLILIVAAIVLIAAGLLILWAVTGYKSFGIGVAAVGGIFLIMWFKEFMSNKRSEENRRSLGYDGNASETGKRS